MECMIGWTAIEHCYVIAARFTSQGSTSFNICCPSSMQQQTNTHHAHISTANINTLTVQSSNTSLTGCGWGQLELLLPQPRRIALPALALGAVGVIEPVQHVAQCAASQAALTKCQPFVTAAAAAAAAMAAELKQICTVRCQSGGPHAVPAIRHCSSSGGSSSSSSDGNSVGSELHSALPVRWPSCRASHWSLQQQQQQQRHQSAGLAKFAPTEGTCRPPEMQPLWSAHSRVSSQLKAASQLHSNTAKDITTLM
jgi:hypothetical protein